MSRIACPRPACLLAVALVILTGAGARGEDGRWVGTWAASPHLTEPVNMPPEPGLANSTLRQVVHVAPGGNGRAYPSSPGRFGTTTPESIMSLDFFVVGPSDRAVACEISTDARYWPMASGTD